MKRLLYSIFIILPLCLNAQHLDNDYIRIGRQKIFQEKYLEAIRFFNQVIIKNETLHDAYFLRGIAKYSLKDYIGAEHDFSQAIYYKPFLPQAYHNRALCRVNLGKTSSAIDDFDQSIKQDPEDYRALVNRALAKYQMDRFEETIEDCNAALKKNHFTTEMIEIRALCRAELGLVEQALLDFNQLIAKNKSDKELFVRRAELYLTQENYTDAYNDLQTALTLDSTYLTAHYTRARYYLAKDEMEAALGDLEYVLDANPKHSLSIFNRAIVYEQLGRQTWAERDYKKVTELNPRNVLALYNWSLLLAKQSRWKEAVERLDEAISIYPEFAEAYLQRSLVLNELGKKKQAAEDYDYHLVIQEQNNLLSEEETAIRRRKYTHLSGFIEDKVDEEPTDEEEIALQLFQRTKMSLFQQSSAKNASVRSFKSEDVDAYNESAGLQPYIHLVSDEIPLDPEEFQRQLKYLNEQIADLGATRDLMYRRALLYANFEYYKEALAELQNLIKEYPDFGLAYFSLSNVYWGMYDLASYFDNPSDLIGMENKNDSKKQRDSYLRLTEEALDKSIKLMPDAYFLYYNYGVFLCWNQKFSDARLLFERAVKVNSQNAALQFNLGALNLYLKNFDEACGYLSRSGELGIDRSYQLIEKYCQ